MTTLLQGIGEYFLGSESRRFYGDQTKFIVAYEQNPRDRSSLLNEIASHEKSFIWRRKIIPNLVTGASVALALYTKDNAYLMLGAIGEGLRLGDLAGDGRYVNECLEVRKAYLEEDTDEWRGFTRLLDDALGSDNK